MLQKFLEQAEKVVIGKRESFRLALSCLLAGGHLLLEDEPGMGKTTFAKTLAKLLNLDFSRIQFTSDLLPADIIGVSIFDRDKQSFVFQPGPIFSQLVLGDELNRASPKTQSAFLQAMEEQAVTADGKTYALERPFFFIATQNPRRSIGTFPLPESQLDRFMMKMALGYPSRDAEISILMNEGSAKALADLEPIWDPGEIRARQAEIRRLHVAPGIAQYIVDIAQESRRLPHGISPRASLALLHAAQAYAWLDHRQYVIPEDVQAVAISVMSHRLISGDELRPEVGNERARELLHQVPVRP
ncbi:AAA family ATPase [Oligoflexus tunisiensis]|uniref:AAA family ATPase n=1 Tax=Oligoflexus tunisiensis TaxID=708132 RepID=UPI000A94C374|nr:MoxR family ATPase [Oligoflexus tunisiensis]